ncbi:MAG: CDP-alcohol phosphatidyltransferase family protein [Deltaproteobacteria bacterium]|nr:CDP-alcohol phosphatidyltransferase family protein [Deltaproteobacteria bacterium]MBW2127913.1 CDP-alcohol phosphatidyltransferase family protein [Deltaproteobacteria bacterium]
MNKMVALRKGRVRFGFKGSHDGRSMTRLKERMEGGSRAGAWTEFMPTDREDYLLQSDRYIALEGKLVSFLTWQKVIQPNHLTYFRFGVGLFLLLFFRHLSYLQIFLLAIVGLLSDFFDGALARAASRKTRLGILIDPLADKFLALTIAFILLERKVLDPVIIVIMLLLEAHVLLIPLISRVRRRKGFLRAGDPFLVVRARQMAAGKIKCFLYGVAFLGLLFAKALSSSFLMAVFEGVLVAGLAVGMVALFIYLHTWWIRDPVSAETGRSDAGEPEGDRRNYGSGREGYES